jgi:predicted negative regulator of RcsB-dependent stress response
MALHDIISFFAENGVWVMIIAVVGIGSYFQYRGHELKAHQVLRMKEMEHEREMKKLEVELAHAKTRPAGVTEA